MENYYKDHKPIESKIKACEYLDEERKQTCSIVLKEWNKKREEKRKQSKTKKR